MIVIKINTKWIVYDGFADIVLSEEFDTMEEALEKKKNLENIEFYLLNTMKLTEIKNDSKD